MIAHKHPVDVGFEARYTWTLKIIARWIEREFDQRYTPHGISKLIGVQME